VAGAGVVDGDEGRAGKSRPQHRVVLGAEALELGVHEPHHLALGDRQAEARQERHDPLAGHLALKMQRQHQMMQMWAAAAHDPHRQRRDQPLAVRSLPALASIARRLRLHRQVLNDDVLIAFVARAGRRPDRKRFRAVDRKLGDAGAAPPLRRLFLVALRSALRPIRRLLHSGRLVRRTRRQPFEPRELVLQRLVLDLQPREGPVDLLPLGPHPLHFAKQSANQADHLGRRHKFKRIASARQHALASTKPFLPLPFPLARIFAPVTHQRTSAPQL